MLKNLLNVVSSVLEQAADLDDLSPADAPVESEEKANEKDPVLDLVERAQQGEPNALYELGCLYWTGTSVEKDSVKAMDCLEKAAALHHAGACFMVAQLCLERPDEPGNCKRAQTLLKEAACAGHAGAQATLASLYYFGNHVKKNEAESAKWAEMAAIQGYPDGLYMYGIMCCTGRGVTENKRKGTRLLKQAAEAGHPNAQSALNTLV